MKKVSSNPALLSPTFLVPVFWGLSLIWSISWFEPHPVLRLVSIGFCFLAAALSWGQGLQDGIRRPHGAVTVILLLFWALAGGSVLWSGIPYVSFIAFCTFSLLPLTFFSLATNGEAQKLLRLCSAGAFILGLALAVFVIIQFFFMPDMLVHKGVRYPFANPNSFAGFLSLCLFGGLGWMLSETDRKRSNIALVFCALCVAALIILAGRGALLSLSLGLVVFLCCAGLATLKKHKRCLGGVFAAGMASFIAASFMEGSRKTVMERFGQMADQGGEIISGRTDIWRAAWAMIEHHMLAGSGIGTFFLYYPEYRLPADWYSGGYMAHNDPLQFWMEMGIVAPILFYAALAFVLVKSFSVLKAVKADDPRRIYLLASVCGMGAFALHTHITFHFYVAPLLLLFGLALAWWAVMVADIRGDGDKVLRWPERWPLAAGWSVVLLPFFALYFVLQGFLLSEYYADRARILMAEGDVNGFAAYVNRADSAGFGRNARAYIQAAAIPLGILDSEGAVLPQDEREALEKQINGLLDKAEHHNPRLVGVPYYRALLAGYMRKPDDVELYLRQAVALNPQHLPSRETLLQFYKERGQTDRAVQVAKDGLSWQYALFDPVSFYRLAMEVFIEAEDKDALAVVQEKLQGALMQRVKRDMKVPSGKAISRKGYVPDDSLFVP